MSKPLQWDGPKPAQKMTKALSSNREVRSKSIRQRHEDLRQQLLADIEAIDIGGRVMSADELAKHRAEVCMKLGCRDRLTEEEFE